MAKYDETIRKYNSFVENSIDTNGNYFSRIKKAWRYFGIGLGSVVGYLFLIQTNFLNLTGPMPSVEDLQNPKVSQASEIFTNDNKSIGKFFTQNRVKVDSVDMSPWLFKALLATEDKRFFQHSGIDLKSMAGVFFGLFKGGERGGGSTISQQLAKNLYSTRKKDMEGYLYHLPIIKQLVYKTKEWVTAVSLERNFTKGEIMTQYFNTVEYGNNSFGIKTAAKTYFNKLPKDLKIEEAAVLVGLQKGTTLYNPIRNPKNSKKRRDTVLGLMKEKGYISEKEFENLTSKEIVLNVNKEDIEEQGSYIKFAVRKAIEEWAKANKEEINVYEDGLKIYTTLDSKLQEYAEDAVDLKMKDLQKAFDGQWKGKNPWVDEKGKEIPGFIEKVAQRTDYFKFLKKKFNGNEDSINVFMNKPRKMKVFTWNGEKDIEMSPIDSIKYYKRFLQTGMMAFDPHTGFIKSWVGGTNYKFFQYDHVKQGRRQPGSTFKPFVYLAAIDNGVKYDLDDVKAKGGSNAKPRLKRDKEKNNEIIYEKLTPCHTRRDVPYESKWENSETKEEEAWRPENANGRFSMGTLTLRKAIARSVNSIAAKLGEEVGIDKVIEYAQKLGITSPLQKVGSLALGTSDVSLYELIAAYGVFANEGVYTEPILVTRIEDRSGKILYEIRPKSKKVLSEQSAFQMQYMLRGNTEEGGATGIGLKRYSPLFANGGQVAGKTGTTSNNSDAWYVGFTKDLVCGVWVGGDDRSIHFRGSMGEGASSAMPIFGTFMEKVYGMPVTGYKAGAFPKPVFELSRELQSCTGYYQGGKSREVIEIIDESTDSTGSSPTPEPEPQRLPSIEPIEGPKRDTVKID